LDDGFTSLEEAFSASVTELEQAGSSDAEPAQPPVEAQVTAADETPSESPVEQPEPDADGGDELAKAMLDVEDDMDTPDSPGDKPGDIWAQEVQFDTADGPVTATVEELKAGYLRQGDYTRKTQAIADERKNLESADAFYTRFREDPSEFARQLAVEAGWLESDARPVKVKEYAKVPSPTEYDEMVQEEVRKRLEEDPRIERDAMAQQRQLVAEAFDSIEKKAGMSIPPDLRKSIVAEAVERGNTDLEMIFWARRAKALDKQQQASQIRKGAPARPGQPHQSQTDPSAPPETVETLEDAYKQALAEQQAS
jgi:hypothetical protein